jgi:hypothetical protein
MYTHSVGIQYKSPEGTIANTTEDFHGDFNEGIDTNVPPSTVDQVEACPVTVAKIVSCCIFSAVAVTLKTYAAGVLKQTIPVAAGKQITWGNTFTFACPFTDNFDTMKISNADPAKNTNFKARFCLTD